MPRNIGTKEIAKEPLRNSERATQQKTRSPHHSLYSQSLCSLYRSPAPPASCPERRRCLTEQWPVYPPWAQPQSPCVSERWLTSPDWALNQFSYSCCWVFLSEDEAKVKIYTGCIKGTSRRKTVKKAQYNVVKKQINILRHGSLSTPIGFVY